MIAYNFAYAVKRELIKGEISSYPNLFFGFGD